MDTLDLTYWQRRRLEDQLRHAETARVYRRTLAVLEASRGRAVSEIADILGVTRQSVYNWIDAYREALDSTALFEGERSGRPSLWDEQTEATLRYLMDHRPDEFGYYAVKWTSPLLNEQLRCVLGKQISLYTIREELRHLGYIWKRGRYELAPDPELEKKTPDSPSDPQFAAWDSAVGGG
jgi:transposase